MSATSLEKAAALVASALRRLIFVLDVDDPEGHALRRLVADLGWTLPGEVPASLRDLGGAVRQLMRSLWALDDASAGAREGTGSEVEVAAALVDVATALVAASDALQGLPGRLSSELPADYLSTTHLDTEIATRLLDALIVDAVALKRPIASSVLKLIGLLEIERMPTDPARHQPGFVRRRIRWDRIGTLLSDPGAVFNSLFGWGDDRIRFRPLLDALRLFTWSIGVPGRVDYPTPALFEVLKSGMTVPATYRADRILEVPLVETELANLTVGVTMLPPPAAPGRQGLAVTLLGTLGSGIAIPLGRHVSLSLESPIAAAAGIAVLIQPGERPRVVRDVEGPATPVDAGRIALRVNYEREPDEDALVVLSVPGGSRIETRAAYVGAGVEAISGDTDVFVEGGVRKARIVLTLEDSFLGDILSGADIVIDFDLGISWSKQRGVGLHGSASLTTTIPVRAALGPVTFESITVGIAPSADGVGLDIGATATTTLGPVTLRIERIGVRADTAFHAGNLGPLDLNLGFRPPTGIGVAIDAGAITGSGFLSFDPAAGRYGGGLALQACEVGLSALGLLDTKPPGGGYSFVAIVTAEFEPVQLGFGFTLNGVGGLVGINRRVDTQALRAALAGPGIADIFFASDPVGQAGRLVTDLATYFPAAKGRYVFGPAAKIGWGTPTLVEADVAILLEVPEPVRLVLLGKAHTALPSSDEALIVLNIDVVGEIDFAAKRLSIDAALHDSQVVGFTIEGEMAFRLFWGDPPNFAFAVGGMNPHFQPPAGFPVLKRVKIPIGADDNPRIDIQGYLALTSNTAQVGARADLYAEAAGLNIRGWLGFDALFMFSPFSFRVDLTAGVELRRGDTVLAGITFDGTLTGPSPWHVWGEACLSLWLFDLCVDFDATFGEERKVELPPVDAWPPLRDAIEDPRNWSASLPPATVRVVALAPPPGTTAEMLLDPLGSATLREKVVPLNRRITRFGAAKPTGVDRFDITGVTVGGVAASDYRTVKDWFARAQFEELGDAERLSAPSFEKMDAGIRVASDAVAAGNAVAKDIEYETIVVRTKWELADVAPYRPGLAQQLGAIEVSAAALAPLRHSGTAKFAPRPGDPGTVTLDDAGFVVATVDGLDPRPDITAPTTKGAARLALAEYLALHPDERDLLQVVPLYEIAEAA